MLPQMINIKIQQNELDLFLEICERASDDMGNAGCNDFYMKDTPQNRQLLTMIQAKNHGMTFTEYLASDEYSELQVYSDDMLCTTDTSVFRYVISIMKNAIKERDK